MEGHVQFAREVHINWARPPALVKGFLLPRLLRLAVQLQARVYVMQDTLEQMEQHVLFALPVPISWVRPPELAKGVLLSRLLRLEVMP